MSESRGHLISWLETLKRRLSKADGWTYRFFAKLGLPRDEEEFSGRAWAVLSVSVGVVLASLLIGVWSWRAVAVLNLIFVFIAASLRLGAHGQSHPRWKLLDGLGKLIAYVCSLIVILVAFIGGLG